MSRKKNDNQNEVNEPWEQPIYDTESDEIYSRSAKRNSKKSNTTFLTIVLIMIFFIAAIPIGTGVWFIFEKNKPETTPTVETTTQTSISTSESTKESETSTKESSTSVSTESTETVESTTKEETPEMPTADQNNQYIEVLDGEGPNNVAARAGITVEELYRLNGMTAENFFLSPGQQLRIR